MHNKKMCHLTVFKVEFSRVMYIYIFAQLFSRTFYLAKLKPHKEELYLRQLFWDFQPTVSSHPCHIGLPAHKCVTQSCVHGWWCPPYALKPGGSKGPLTSRTQGRLWAHLAPLWLMNSCCDRGCQVLLPPTAALLVCVLSTRLREHRQTGGRLLLLLNTQEQSTWVLCFPCPFLSLDSLPPLRTSCFPFIHLLHPLSKRSGNLFKVTSKSLIGWMCSLSMDIWKLW